MTPSWVDFDAPAVRQALAAGVVLAWLLLCGAVAWAARRRAGVGVGAGVAAVPARAPAGGTVLVAHASQTGFAEQLATQTAQALETAGVPTRLVALGSLTAAQLAGVDRALFIASTSGEGDAPDAALAFVRDAMGAVPPLSLPGLHYGVLALGDSGYSAFCGFGRALDGWLQATGATALFPRIEVDNADASALGDWRHRLSHLAGTSDVPDWDAPPWTPWRLVERHHLNAGSEGGPVYHLSLEPVDGSAPDWRSGDLVQVQAPEDPGRPRDYSIASIPEEGSLQLTVRQERRADGTLGCASGWLTEGVQPGGTVLMRVRAHANFRLDGNAGRPLVLVGNGTGIAGLRSHLQARALQGGPPCWLVFGERHAAHDRLYRDGVEAWQASGVLGRVDWVFSRDGVEREYVQHRLQQEAQRLRTWVNEGAAVYVCGSLDGMAGGVHQALLDVLGALAVESLRAEGRYRRDVY